MNYNLLSEAVHLLCQGYIELINLPKSEQEVFWLKGANSEHDAKYLAQKWAVERHEQKKQANFSAFFCSRNDYYQQIIISRFGIKDANQADFLERFCKLAFNNAPGRIFGRDELPKNIKKWRDYGDFHNWAIFFECRYRRNQGDNFIKKISKFL